LQYRTSLAGDSAEAPTLPNDIQATDTDIAAATEKNLNKAGADANNYTSDGVLLWSAATALKV
jgi:hypothetical protein